MSLRVSRSSNLSFLAVVLAGSLAGCGGGDSPTAPNPTPAPLNPGGNPTPAPTPDPRANLAPGPVTRFDIKVRSIAPCRGSEDLDCNTFRPKVQDPDGAWVVCEGDFVVFDGNQANAQGQECRWTNDPVYTVSDPEGITRRLNSSNPFLLRTDIVGRGDVTISASLDGVQSNPGTLLVRAKRNGCPAPQTVGPSYFE